MWEEPEARQRTFQELLLEFKSASQVCLRTFVIPALWKQEDYLDFKASVGYIVNFRPAWAKGKNKTKNSKLNLSIYTKSPSLARGRKRQD